MSEHTKMYRKFTNIIIASIAFLLDLCIPNLKCTIVRVMPCTSNIPNATKWQNQAPARNLEAQMIATRFYSRAPITQLPQIVFWTGNEFAVFECFGSLVEHPLELWC